jgi:hypothetical protein
LSSLLGSFEVQCHEFNEVRRIDFIEGLEDTHLEFVQQQWVPRLLDARSRAVIAYHQLPASKQGDAAWQEKQGRYGAPDSHWDWHEKNQSMLGTVHRMFALLDSASVEAMMRLDLSKPSRIQPTPHTPVVYVDYLAVAPWNRSQIQSPCRFTGLGKLMLGAAVSLSLEEGMGGRCGLHSLKQSEGFYRRAGMNDLGIDPNGDLRYFEFSPDAAEKFLEI